MDVDSMVPLVRSALAVSSSYDDEKIPDLIRRTINRLLRDYHFPKAVRKLEFPALIAGDTEFALPDGFKKELEFRLFNPLDDSYTDPLTKKEGFQLPYPDGSPTYYWLEGTKLVIDTPLDSTRAGFSAFLWYESMDSASNEDWLCNDFPDSVMYFSVLRGAAEFRKPEVAQIYSQLWADERQSLAVYANELEWNNAVIYQREARGFPSERYPAA
jgi:hypothetical protein